MLPSVLSAISIHSADHALPESFMAFFLTGGQNLHTNMVKAFTKGFKVSTRIYIYIYIYRSTTAKTDRLADDLQLHSLAISRSSVCC